MLLLLCLVPCARAATKVSDLADLSLEQLANLQISSVSRQRESLSQAPAAVYVITHEDIVRSGVTTLPEALRLAPGVEVTRKGSSSWSISIRGFNNDLANKLLVLIDGRSVYSPLYAGVFWDVQDTLLDDIDRIEVIEGPGGTLWGANAVNGVINIITRSAKDTRGGYTEIATGNEEKGLGGFRYGGRLAGNVAARAYVKYHNQDSTRLATGGEGVDNWHLIRGGFRLDWDRSASDNVMFEGNAYSGTEYGKFREDFTLGTLPGPDVMGHVAISGGNLLGRWNRTFNPGSRMKLQFYYDYTHRAIPGTFTESRHTVDIDFQHHYSNFNRNDIVWGAAFRLTSDKLGNTLFATFTPDSRTDLTFSGFLRDKIDLWRQRLFLTLGSKFEHNDYTGFEYQPNARLTWLVTGRQTVWGAVSRAVRVPSRLDADLRLTAPYDLGVPLYIMVSGSHDFNSEKLVAYETGYRIQATDDLTFDVAGFYNVYEDLQVTEPGTPGIVPNPPSYYIILPATLENGMRGESYGSTVMLNWKPLPRWRLQLQYSYLDLQLHLKPGYHDTAGQKIEGDSPENQFAVHSFLDLPHGVSLYTAVRYVDRLPAQSVDSYVALDVGLGWHPAENVEISINGRNLLHKTHLEYGGANEIERSIYGRLTWRF